MRPLASLLRARQGIAATEFGLIAPVFCLLLVGGFDVAHTLYMRTAIQGIVQKTARDSTLETGVDGTVQGALDEKVRRQVRALTKYATLTFKRRYYRTFSDAAAAKAETFTDTNGNGTCDGPRGLTPGEPYVDANLNSKWDSDGGNEGQGGARDRTVYTVTATYPRLLPLHKFITSISDTVTVKAATVLSNQPYADQGSYGAPVSRNCP